MTVFYEYWRRTQSLLGGRILFALAKSVHRLPLGMALSLGRGLGWLAPRLSPRHLRRICHDITAAYGPALTSVEAEATARQCYRKLGECLVEFLRLPYMTGDEIRSLVHLEGLEHVEAALARGHGVILLTAHLGNWELCGTAMGLSGFPTTAIARPQKDTALTELFTKVREAHGLRVVPMTDVRECIRVLKRNECIGILGDLNARQPGVFVRFFGRLASTYLGTAYLAHVTGATILPIFDERAPDHSHRVRIGAPIPLGDTGDRQRDMLITTMRVQEAIEREIRRRPADWFWLVRRWTTTPQDIADLDRILVEDQVFTPEEAARWRTWDDCVGIR